AKGSIVNVTSIAGSRVHPFAGAAYATSKAALAGLTREMAADFAPHGIRVNAIAPGEIDTSILSPGTDKIVEQIPMRRLGTPDEVAKII
ncbi:SDR family NAD(P)-dependent oxidoreductase, partial [Enterobacter cloacae]